MTDTPILAKAASKTSDAHTSSASRRLAQIHRWIALALGVQVFLWMLSGVVMSWLSTDLVRANSAATLNLPVELASYNYVAPGGILARSKGATDLSLQTFLGEAVYITRGNGQNNMFNALSGEKISPLRKQQAIQVANIDYAGNAPIKHAYLLSKAPKEFQGPLPVWQVSYQDDHQTRLYISPFDGSVIMRRNRIWQVYDVFRMLHIMDYDKRENYNNPLIRIASATGLLFALSGLGLILIRLRGGHYFSPYRKPDNGDNKIKTD